MLVTAPSPEKAQVPSCQSDVCESLENLVLSYRGMVQNCSPSKGCTGQNMLRKIIRQYCKVMSNQFESVHLFNSSNVLFHSFFVLVKD